MRRLRNKKGRFMKGHGKVRKHTKQKRTKRRATRSNGKRRTRSNPGGMPIMLVNPSHGGRKRRRKASSSRRAARRTRRRTYATRRNPSTTWTRAATSVGLGALGGGVIAGVDYGVDMMPVGAVAKILTVGGVGLVSALLAAKYADERLGAGAMGGTMVSIIKRGTEAYALSSLAKKSDATADKPVDPGVNLEAGRVYRVDAGAPPRELVRQTGARSMAPEGMPSPSFREAGAVFREAGVVLRRSAHNSGREAGASAYVKGPLKLFGPRSWAYDYQSRGIRSAHDSR